MKNQIFSVREQFLAECGPGLSPEQLEALRVRYLGRKGLVTALFKELSSVDKADRPQIGKLLNELRSLVEKSLEEGRSPQDSARPRQRFDLTLPGRMPAVGRKHPLTQVSEEIKAIFSRMGFQVVEGPEVETDYLNFEALNIPKLHPARDMQDTLYISEELVLRTHTSPVQIRYMQAHRPPIRIIAPGRVYRRDTPDASHSPFFHQVEGLCVGENVSLGDLKATLSVFAREIFERDVKVRLRPSFFPFTEPSAELDIWWESARGGRWLELLGCGMVHPNVLRGCDIDPGIYSGWAFGMGIDRVAMLKFGINDIRLFFENDLRFLEQF